MQFLGGNADFTKQRNNKQNITNIKGETTKKSMFVRRGWLKSKQNEQGVKGNIHTKVCSKNKQKSLPSVNFCDWISE